MRMAQRNGQQSRYHAVPLTGSLAPKRDRQYRSLSIATGDAEALSSLGSMVRPACVFMPSIEK